MSQLAPTQRLDMTLQDRLTQEKGWVYMTGMQALVRLPIQQRKRDQAVGWNTGGYISGYRGSPVGTYDMSLWQAEAALKAHNIYFQPGVNEDLAATATWGAQLVGLFPGAKVDGVFSIWYGKAPGMDRSMDPLRHANLAGTNAKGGTLLLVGDDHGAKSSTLACSSDFNFASMGAPLLAPANAQDILDLGLHGIAMSRYCSTLVGMKLVTDVVEGGGSVYVAPDSPAIVIPELDAGDTAIKVFTPILEQERLLWDVKLRKALAYAQANRLNRIEGTRDARIGIVAAGKTWQDTQQALSGLGYRDGKLGELPVKLLKVGMVWPLDTEVVREFALGLDALVVVEEKRPLLEDQIRSALYGTASNPRLVGKSFAGAGLAATPGATAFPNYGEIDPQRIAQVLVQVVMDADPNCGLSLPTPACAAVAAGGGAVRMPSFCAGCPHGRSTQVIAGSRALAGIGCHTMAMLRNPQQTNSVSQMGGEGAMWLGQFPFTDEAHVFANMGDGTYFHSGLLAIRAAVAAKATMTYKLLHNGFVSMTGGQPHDGEIGPLQMIAQVRAEGVDTIALVSDEPEKYQGVALGAGVSLHPRTELELVQDKLRKMPGVTVIIYDQPCATERRRQRRRGKWADPDRRVYIHPDVCEGCGDCSTVSGCMAIEPLETPYGRKRKVNQSACNKDFSCVEGFCPSLVTVSGAAPRKAQRMAVAVDVSHLPMPALPVLDRSWSVLVSGIGGAGVVTTGQTLAIAAHADGYFASNLDITGLAQKYGAVHSHVKFAASTAQMRATRIATGEADALIGCDLVVAAGDEALSKLAADQAIAVLDTTVVPTAEFSMNPDWQLSREAQVQRVTGVLGERALAIDAQDLAEKVMGDRIFANMVLLGAAWQRGGIPLSLAAMARAIVLNGVAAQQNQQAFDLGRLAAADPQAAQALAGEPAAAARAQMPALSLDELVAQRAASLTAYRDAAFAHSYTECVARVRQATADEAAAKAVAHGLFKLMAVKDEWEVARLYTQPAFARGLQETFDGDLELTFHFGAWPLGGRDANTGKAVKRAVKGNTAMRMFKLLNRLRFLRGTAVDPFRNSAEATLNRQLLADYEADIAFALSHWSADKAEAGRKLLNLPEHIRGFGHVRERHAAAVGQQRAALKAALQAAAPAAN